MAYSAPATARRPIALLPAPTRGPKPTVPSAAARLRVSASAASSDVPDFLSSDWSVPPFQLPPFLPCCMLRCACERSTRLSTRYETGERLGCVIRTDTAVLMGFGLVF